MDRKVSFAKQDAFESAWKELYGYQTDSAIIEWIPDTNITSIDISSDSKKTIITDSETIIADVVSYIPTMKASKFAYDAGLVESNSFDMDRRWCPVNQQTFESLMPNKKGIYIIGDSSKTNLAKSGYAGNSEAKACAIAISTKIKGLSSIPNTIITNGCYSFITKDYAISIFQKFRLTDDKSKYIPIPQGRKVSPVIADSNFRKQEFKEGHGWYSNFRKDCFGVK